MDTKFYLIIVIVCLYKIQASYLLILNILLNNIIMTNFDPPIDILKMCVVAID